MTLSASVAMTSLTSQDLIATSGSRARPRSVRPKRRINSIEKGSATPGFSMTANPMRADAVATITMAAKPLLDDLTVVRRLPHHLPEHPHHFPRPATSASEPSPEHLPDPPDLGEPRRA